MPIIVIFLSQARVMAADVNIPPDWQVRFLESHDEAEIISTCRDADGLLSVGTMASITARIIAKCPNLKIIQCLGAGFNQVDLSAAEQWKIPVANSSGLNSRTVAEFAIATIIALQRRILEADAEIKAGRYVSFRVQALKEGLRELGVSRLGVIGMGHIGLHLARIAGLLGAYVSYYSAHRRSREIESQFGITYQSMDNLLAESDIISLHVPLNKTTRGLISAKELVRMKRSSLLVNTSRGAIVDQIALAQALESGHLGGAAIDTFDPEPPTVEHPLLNLSLKARRRLLLTPHIAGVTESSFQRMLAFCVTNIERVLHGEKAMNQVNSI